MSAQLTATTLPACKRCGNALPEDKKMWCNDKCRTMKGIVECAVPGCNETQEVRASYAAGGRYLYCATHTGQPRVTKGFVNSRPAHVYIAYNEARGFGKVGHTQKLVRRIGQLGPKEWVVVQAWEFPTGYDANEVESELKANIGTLGEGFVGDGRGDTETFLWDRENVDELMRIAEGRWVEQTTAHVA